MTVDGRGSRIPHEVRRARTEALFAATVDAPASEREQLLDEVIELNLQVAQAVARRFRNRGVSLDDLEQVAAMALVRAAHKFDPSQERDFLTYAVPTMSGELKRYFRDHGWMIRPPRRIQEVQSKVTDLYRQGHDDGTPMTAAEIAAIVEVSEETVVEALSAQGLFQPSSLDRVVGDAESGEMTLADMLAHESSETERAEARVTLQPVLRKLSQRDRRILYLRFVQEQTQEQIGNELGVTQMQVSRLLSRILGTMREELEPQPA